MIFQKFAYLTNLFVDFTIQYSFNIINIYEPNLA